MQHTTPNTSGQGHAHPAFASPGDRIEILSSGTLLREHEAIVHDFRHLSKALGIGLGWHYLLDLAWTVNQVSRIADRLILDAGAGQGVLQWYLAQRGARVLSVDRMSRTYLPLRLRARFDVRGLTSADLESASVVLRRELTADRSLAQRAAWGVRIAGGLVGRLMRPASGKVAIHNADLHDLAHLEDESVDCVVSISSLEHNAPADLEVVVAELMRVLRPGGRLIATVGAARDKDWFHAPSHGWCYTESSLRRLFHLRPNATSNYAEFDTLFEELRTCDELRNSLARLYFRSGDNGMPWGRWDPQYQPVGVVKFKAG